MHIGNAMKRVICVMWIMVLLASSGVVAFAQVTRAEGRVVKVFFPLQFGFAQQDANGHYSGYTYEYLMKIAQLTGWRYEFATVEASDESLQAGMDAVQTGELDLMGTTVYSPELAEQFLFSSVPYGETSFTLISLEDRQELNGRTLMEYPELRIAVIEKAVGQTEMLNNYCASSGLQYEPVYAVNNVECMELVRSGQADLMISKDVALLDGFKTVLRFGTQPFYFVSSKENAALMNELNQALESIHVSAPGIQSQLHNQYFLKPSDFALALTTEEQKFVEETPPLRVAVSTNRTPIQSYDEQKGTFHGIMVDILAHISQRSGLKFELVPVSSDAEAEAMINAGTVDMVAGLPYYYASPEKFYESNQLLTSPVLTAPIVRVSSAALKAKYDETLVDSSIKIFEGQDGMQYVEDIGWIFEQIERGIYEEAYVNGYIAQSYLGQGLYRNVTLTTTPYSSYGLSLGVARQQDLRLIGILEQSVVSLTAAEVEDIIYKNTSSVRRVGLVEFIKRNPFPFAFATLLVLGVISLLMLSLFLKTRRINKLICAEKNKYQVISQIDGLTQIYNSTTFKLLAVDYLSAMAPVPQGALLVIDIDDFKNINDSYGHLEGDKTLRNLAHLLTEVFGDGSLVGRMGGDEFAVLIKNVGGASMVAERCDELERRSMQLIEQCQTTVSIGATLFEGEGSFEALFKAADAALYEVKNHGKAGYRIDNAPRANRVAD